MEHWFQVLTLPVVFDTQKTCYPYTNGKNDEREVTFTGVPPRNHDVIFNGQRVSEGIPQYIFTNIEDATQFQEEVRGKELIAQFLCQRIWSTSYIEARDEYLKIWKNKHNEQYSISFCASAVSPSSDREFSIALFARELDVPISPYVRLDFELATPMDSLTGASKLRLSHRIPKKRQFKEMGEGSKHLRIIFSSRDGQSTHAWLQDVCFC